MNPPLRLLHFQSSEGSSDINLTLNRPATGAEARRLAWKISNVIEREAANALCECGRRMGDHPAQPPWWPCMAVPNSSPVQSAGLGKLSAHDVAYLTGATDEKPYGEKP